MAGLMSSGAAETLKDAYEQATYASPTIRQSLLADEQTKAEAKRKADDAERVKSAVHILYSLITAAQVWIALGFVPAEEKEPEDDGGKGK